MWHFYTEEVSHTEIFLKLFKPTTHSEDFHTEAKRLSFSKAQLCTCGQDFRLITILSLWLSSVINHSWVAFHLEKVTHCFLQETQTQHNCWQQFLHQQGYNGQPHLAACPQGLLHLPTQAGIGSLWQGPATNPKPSLSAQEAWKPWAQCNSNFNPNLSENVNFPYLQIPMFHHIESILIWSDSNPLTEACNFFFRILKGGWGPSDLPPGTHILCQIQKKISCGGPSNRPMFRAWPFFGQILNIFHLKGDSNFSEGEDWRVGRGRWALATKIPQSQDENTDTGRLTLRNTVTFCHVALLPFCTSSDQILACLCSARCNTQETQHPFLITDEQ